MASIDTEIQRLEKLTSCKANRTDEGLVTGRAAIPNPAHKRIELKFQTTSEYPKEPMVTIVCGDLPQDEKDSLNSSITAMENTSIIDKFRYLEQEIAKLEIYEQATTPKSSKQSRKENAKPKLKIYEQATTPKSSKQSPKQNAKPDIEPKAVKARSKTEKPSKKMRMRTAADVIKRIKWDEMLDEEQFIVGYLDRFIGIVEQPFGSFNWVNPAEAEWDDLNIPEHRIQYFKYRGKIVWDKNRRMDNIFGSTGGSTIDSLVNEQLSLLDKEDHSLHSADRVISSSPGDNVDDDDDEDITVSVSIQSENPLAAQQKRISHKREGPTHFIAVPITNEQIQKALSSIQAECYAMSNVDLSPFMMDTQNLHITLCALRINDDNDLDMVSQCLYEHAEEYNDKLEQEIAVEGLDSFWSRVLYARVHANDSLESFVMSLRRKLSDLGVRIYDDFTFVPHITILKLKNPKYCDVQFPIDHLIKRKLNDDKNFGVQSLNQIALFSMERDDKGLYKKPFYLDL